MLGLSGQPESEDGQKLKPMVNYNIQAMSIGFLVEEESPMIWRGPMVTSAMISLQNIKIPRISFSTCLQTESI